jgi:hypothetical protein
VENREVPRTIRSWRSSEEFKSWAQEEQYRRCRFPDREIPDKNKAVDSLTIGVWGIGLHVNCAHGTREIANSDFPILEGGQKGVLWVVRTPERSWKSSLTLRA